MTPRVHARLGLLDFLASHEVLGCRLFLVGRDGSRLILTGDFVHQRVLG